MRYCSKEEARHILCRYHNLDGAEPLCGKVKHRMRHFPKKKYILILYCLFWGHHWMPSIIIEKARYLT